MAQPVINEGEVGRGRRRVLGWAQGGCGAERTIGRLDISPSWFAGGQRRASWEGVPSQKSAWVRPISYLGELCSSRRLSVWPAVRARARSSSGASWSRWFPELTAELREQNSDEIRGPRPPKPPRAPRGAHPHRRGGRMPTPRSRPGSSSGDSPLAAPADTDEALGALQDFLQDHHDEALQRGALGAGTRRGPVERRRSRGRNSHFEVDRWRS